MPAPDHAADLPVGRLRVRLLGALQVIGPDGVPQELPPRDRRKLLLRLAVERGPVSVEQLCVALERDRPAVHTLKKRLVDDGYPVEVVGRGGYRLALDRYSVDLHEFMDAMEALPPRPEAGELDRLARMWAGDPAEHHELPRETWQPARRGLRRLAEALRALPESERPASARALPELFPEDRDLRVLIPAPPRKNLLIVDDTDADELGERLSGRCNIIPLKGLPEWRDFCSGSRPYQVNGAPIGLHQVDGALIDLHLDDQASRNGMEIIEHLCKYTRIPTVLVSAYPDPAIGELNSTFLQRHRLLRVVPKGLKGRDLYSCLDELARQLFDDSAPYQLLRLRAQLAHAVFRLEEERAHPRNRARASAAPWERERHRAQEAIDRGDVRAATRLVGEFCNADWS